MITVNGLPQVNCKCSYFLHQSTNWMLFLSLYVWSSAHHIRLVQEKGTVGYLGEKVILCFSLEKIKNNQPYLFLEPALYVPLYMVPRLSKYMSVSTRRCFPTTITTYIPATVTNISLWNDFVCLRFWAGNGRNLFWHLNVFLDFGQNMPPPTFCIVPTYKI